MNLLLLEPEELDRSEVFLPAGDRRAIHCRDILATEPGSRVSAGIVDGPTGVLCVDALDASGLKGRFVAGEQATSGDVARAAATAPRRRSSTAHIPCDRLLLAAVRPIVFKRLVKDLATLGVRYIDVFRAELTERSYLQARIWDEGALRQRLIAGAEQGGGTRLPVVRRFDSLAAAIENVPGAGRRLKLVAETEPFDPPQSIVHQLRAGLPCDLVVGPERGLTGRERGQLEEAGFLPLSLGPAILRTETAATGAVIGLTMLTGAGFDRSSGSDFDPPDRTDYI